MINGCDKFIAINGITGIPQKHQYLDATKPIEMFNTVEQDTSVRNVLFRAVCSNSASIAVSAGQHN